MNLKKGIRGHDVNKDDIFQICNFMTENDMEYLQLVLEKSVDNFEYGKFSVEYAQSILNKLGNIRVAVLGGYINPSSTNPEELKKSLDSFKEKIRYAEVLKAEVVGTETGCFKGGNDTEEAYQYVLKNLKELCLEAKKHNVNVGIEGVHCFVINTPERMKRLVDDLSSQNVKVIFDPVNYINIDNYNEQDRIINDVFELLADKLVVLHAKDFVVSNGKIQGAIPGEGTLNYHLIFKKMKEYNLNIPVISEGIDEENALKAFGNLEKIWREI